jgi:hypothetical protein
MKQNSKSADLDRAEFLLELIKLKEQNPEEFMQLILATLKRHPDLAIDDAAPVENKTTALEKMLSFLEEKENYEDCAFVRDLTNQIKDGSQA